MSLKPEELTKLKEVARNLRVTLIDVMAWAGGSHIGGSLSIVDILTILYFKLLKVDPANPDWEERDRFVLSKGHAAAGYIPVLAKRGFFPEEDLKSFNHFGSAFAMHPDSNKISGCDVSTGSLGHGLSIAAGIGLGARCRGMDYRTVCLLGDGECCEGSVWEAAMSIAHYGLTNVVTVVDRNRLMIDGETEEIIGLEPFGEKWRAFGFEVIEADGHDFESLDTAFERAWEMTDRPAVIIANTVKGKGVDFMENNVVYHYASGDSAVCDEAKASILKG